MIAVLPLVREIGFALAVALILTLLLSKKIKESFAVFVAAALPYFIWTRYNTAQMPITFQSNNIQYAFEHFVTPPMRLLLPSWCRGLSSTGASIFPSLEE